MCLNALCRYLNLELYICYDLLKLKLSVEVGDLPDQVVPVDGDLIALHCSQPVAWLVATLSFR